MQTAARTLLRGYRLASCQPDSRRPFFKWLTVIWNQVDEKMIKEMGPEAAAAQWLIRNGAKVKWYKGGQMFDEYDQLMKHKTDFIVAIDATNSSITHDGFPYLKNLHRLQKIIFNQTDGLQDKALHLLAEYKLPLRHLEVIKCHDITDSGILALKDIPSLNYLKLAELSSVQDKAACTEALKKLADCKVEWE